MESLPTRVVNILYVRVVCAMEIVNLSAGTLQNGRFCKFITYLNASSIAISILSLSREYLVRAMPREAKTAEIVPSHQKPKAKI